MVHRTPSRTQLRDRAEAVLGRGAGEAAAPWEEKETAGMEMAGSLRFPPVPLLLAYPTEGVAVAGWLITMAEAGSTAGLTAGSTAAMDPVAIRAGRRSSAAIGRMAGEAERAGVCFALAC